MRRLWTSLAYTLQDTGLKCKYNKKRVEKHFVNKVGLSGFLFTVNLFDENHFDVTFSTFRNIFLYFPKVFAEFSEVFPTFADFFRLFQTFSNFSGKFPEDYSEYQIFPMMFYLFRIISWLSQFAIDFIQTT